MGTPGAVRDRLHGNVGSSIYYALGVTAVFALGVDAARLRGIAGLIFAATALTYTEGTVRFRGGGSSSFARHAFNELVSFGAAWAQMLNYIITIAIFGVLRPALPLDLLGPAAGETPGTSSAAPS